MADNKAAKLMTTSIIRRLGAGVAFDLASRQATECLALAQDSLSLNTRLWQMHSTNSSMHNETMRPALHLPWVASRAPPSALPGAGEAERQREEGEEKAIRAI